MEKIKIGRVNLLVASHNEDSIKYAIEMSVTIAV